MAVTLEEAIAAARLFYPGDQWLNMSPREQTRLIYQEMRRIDLTRAGDQSAVPSGSLQLSESVKPDRAVPDEVDTRQCAAEVKTRSSGRCAWKATTRRNGIAYCGFHARLEDWAQERRCVPIAAD